VQIRVSLASVRVRWKFQDLCLDPVHTHTHTHTHTQGCVGPGVRYCKSELESPAPRVLLMLVSLETP